ncbi:MAG: hypothetical protein R2685_10780 [Candidatus Nitrosocosmicus sp.]|nr:hypothetical protein [Candidatus Nitrosocosmicus sp.]
MSSNTQAFTEVYSQAYKKHARDLEPLRLAIEKVREIIDPEAGAFEFFKNKPFWRWDISREEHSALAKSAFCNCCFNHMIGLPVKPDTNLRYPMFEYERLMFEHFIASKENPKSIPDPSYYYLVVKATGLGISEFILRIMAWLAVRNREYNKQRFGVISGTTLTEANVLLERFYDLFYAFPELPIKKTLGKLIVNGVTIQAFPADNVKSMRSYKDFRFLFADEAAFFDKNKQKETRTVLERYHTKSKPFVWLVSTPNNEQDICYQLMTTPEDVRGYKLFEFNYEWGMNIAPHYHGAWLFTEEDIEEQKKKSDFEREYNLKFSGKKGNLLSDFVLARNIVNKDYAAQIGYVPYFDLRGLINQSKVNQKVEYPKNIICIDPAFGTSHDSSHTGILYAQKRLGKVELVYGDELPSPDYLNFIQSVALLAVKRNTMKILIDGWWSHVIKDIKRQIGEYPNYEELDKVELERQINDPNGMRVCPIYFNQKGDLMTQQVVSLFEQGIFRYMKEQTKIHTALSTAWVTDSKYDKDESGNDDLFDCIRMLTLALGVE